jgi:hypothetical protein
MLFRHSNSPVLPGHRPASLGGFCVSRVSFLQKKLRERRGANRHASGQLAEIFLIRREFLTDATEMTGGLGSRHGCACIRRKIYRGNGPRMRDGRTWRVGILCPAAGGCRAVCCFGWSYLPNHHVGGRYRLLRSCGRSSNRLRKWRSGSMGEAATTVRCVGGAEAPKVRSHEKPRSSSARFLRHAALFESKQSEAFPTPANNYLLYEMSKSFLLEIDEPKLKVYSDNTYYKVPDYVWDRVDGNLPVPESPPWVNRA